MAGQSKHSRERREGHRLLTRAPIVAVILEKPIRIPRFLSVKASHVLKGFLNKVHCGRPDVPSRLWLPGLTGAPRALVSRVSCGTPRGGCESLPPCLTSVP